METLEKTDFKPILISEDRGRIEQTLEAAKKRALDINVKLRLAVAFLENEPTTEEKEQILNEGVEAFLKLFRKEFQFKNASDDFNIKALGKEDSFKNIINEITGIDSNFKSYDFNYEDNIVRLSNEGIKKIEESFKVYTRNEKQNEVFNYASNLCEMINKGFEDGYIDSQSKYQIANFIDIIKIPVYEQKKDVIPVVNVILSYNEDGSKRNIYS